MAINIKDADTDRLARELTGQPITLAVRTAIEEQLSVLRRREANASTRDLSEIIDRGRQRRLLDQRAETEILGYEAEGLPI